MVELTEAILLAWLLSVLMDDEVAARQVLALFKPLRLYSYTDDRIIPDDYEPFCR